VLTFEKDGQKPSGGAPPPAAGVVPPAPGAIPPPAAANAFKPAGSTSPGFVPPSRPMRYPGSASAGYGGSPYSGASPVVMGGGGTAPIPNTTPSMNIGGQNVSLVGGGQLQSQPQPENTGPVLSPEEQTLLLEAQRLHYKQIGSPIANLIPPTAVTPPPAPGGAGTQRAQ